MGFTVLGDGLHEQLEEWFDYDRPEKKEPPSEVTGFVKIAVAMVIATWLWIA